jgi:hypothetical protein
LVNVALQGLKILVVKKRYVRPVFKNFRHLFSLKWDIVEVNRLVADIFDYHVLVLFLA